MLQEYNACHVATGDSGSILSLAEVMDSSKLSQILDPCYSYSDRQELIEADLLLTHSSEELKLLVCDMENVISYYEKRMKVLADAMENECGRERSGAHALLRGLLQQTEQQLKQYRGQFSCCLDSSQSHQITVSDSEISSDENTDSESESEI